MLKISTSLHIVHVVRAADGAEWLLCPWRQHMCHVGLAGPNHFWAFSHDAGELQVYCFDARRKIATVKTGYDYRACNGITTVAASSAGDRIFMVSVGTRDRRGQSEIDVIETRTGKILDVLKDHPLAFGSRETSWIYERDDGCVMFPIDARNNKIGFLIYHPSSQTHRTVETADFSISGALGCVSPSGRYALRWDPIALPIKSTKHGVQLGLTVQLWEVEPLKFKRRLQVFWFSPGELQGSWWGAKTVPAATRSNRDWSAIAAAANMRERAPTDAVLREDFTEPFKTDELAWAALQELMGEYSGPPDFTWDDDETGFWYSNVMEYFGRVAIDGTCSPRMVLRRHALAGTDYAGKESFVGPRRILPLGGSKAQADYRYMCRDRPPTKPWGFINGHATVDVSPHYAGSIRFIDREEDGWVEVPWPSDLEKAAEQRIAAFEASLKSVTLRLKSLKESECIGAIERLTSRIRRGIAKLACNDEIKPLFAVRDRTLSEDEFFGIIEVSVPGAVPSLRGLIEEFTRQILDRREVYPSYLFSDGAEGVGAFGPAVRALGVLDINSLELLQRYALCLDVEHECYFPSTVVPAIIRRHGWGDRRMVAFALWMMRYDFYNSIDSYNIIWRDWGMVDAIGNFISPEEMAQMIIDTMKTYSPCEGAPCDGLDMLQRLRIDLCPHGPYEAKLFECLDTLEGT